MTDKSIDTIEDQLSELISSGSLTGAAVVGRKLLHRNPTHSPVWAMPINHSSGAFCATCRPSYRLEPSGLGLLEVLTAYANLGKGQPYPSGQLLGLPDKVFMNLPLEFPES